MKPIVLYDIDVDDTTGSSPETLPHTCNNLPQFQGNRIYLDQYN